MNLINVKPSGKLIPARANTKQAALIDALASKDGATLTELAKLTGWPENVVKTAFYYDLAHKGYGVRTTADEDGSNQRHFLVLPKGVTKPLPHTERKTVTKKVAVVAETAKERKNRLRREKRAAAKLAKTA